MGFTTEEKKIQQHFHCKVVTVKNSGNNSNNKMPTCKALSQKSSYPSFTNSGLSDLFKLSNYRKLTRVNI